jgi:hypothetical protein
MLPLYLLLAIDAANGTLSLWSGAPFTPVALALKAVIAAYLCSVISWTPRMVAELLAVAFCLAAYGAVMPHSLASTVFIAKVAAVVALLAILPRYLEGVPPGRLLQFLRVAFASVALSLLLGLAGLGHDRYGDDDSFLRANGFFAAGNELNIALVAFFWWLSMRLKAADHSTIDTLLYGLCLALMVISGSKTTLVGMVVVGLYFMRRNTTSVLLLAGMLAAAAYLVMALQFWERWTFFFNAYADDGVLAGLTGGRFSRPLQLFEEWSELPWTGLAIFAVGWGYVESDPVDLVMNFGLFGALLFALFASILFRTRGRSMLLCMLLLAASVLAGHVVYSVFAVPFIASVLYACRDARATHRPLAASTSADQ